jgi:hypothetical protein
MSLLSVFGAAIFLCFPAAGQAQTFGCTPAMANDIVCENSKPGTSPNSWDINSYGDDTIQGFATDISVNRGQTVFFKIKTPAASYRLDIYRMGYYGGNGARLITTVNPSASLPQNQPACLTNAATKLYDCGNWAISASWAVPSNATSGIYFAHLIRGDTGGDSHIFFIVRNDASHSDVLFQTSDSSWQAYNYYGGNSLYGTSDSIWDAGNRAYKVSYNRPFNTFETITWVFGAEYPMVRWLEANGYDVTYFTDVDSDRNGSMIPNHKIFMSNSHDEYWSGGQRTNVTAARDAGVNLAFFSGNEVFWKTRWENSIDGSGTPYRTLVCYKETLALSKIDPTSAWTGTWRDPTFSPPADGGKPENSLTGTIFMVNGPATDNTGLAIKVPAADGKMRFWRNTSIANLSSGTATLPQGTLGYEWDAADDNGSRPAGLIFLSTTTQNLTASYLLDYGGVYGAGTATHHMTLYRAPSGALVFGAGTVQWSWGLDNNHENNFGFPTPNPSTDMKQATVNLFADMGVQPATIQSGLLLATKSTDLTPPVSTITSPSSGATVTVGTQITISGTASDAGGGVIGGVEVSVDGGTTWHPANGRASWTYPFTPNHTGSYTLKSRATDDSLNVETPGAGVTVSTGGTTTYSITGTISPTAAGSGATATLSGASSATVTANGSGVYTFSGLSNGTYTVTPTKSGYTFSPLSSAKTVNGANVTGVNFTGSQSTGTSYSISGSVTPAASGTGVTITLTGAASASVLTDASGNFSLAGLANGTYTLTPSKSNYAFSPTQSVVTVTNANVSGIVFTATASAETLFTTQTPVETGQSDGPTVQYELGTLIQSIVPGQITAIRFWKDSKETGTHTGRIWSSSGQLLTSVTFAAETASGWQQQALSAALVVAANTTYVVSVNTGGSYYVASTSGLATQVVNGDLRSVVGGNGVYGAVGVFPASTYQATNYFRDIVFVPGTTYTISGTVTNGGGATVALTGAASASTTADASGNYSFGGLANGSYTVTPSKSGFTMSPPSTSVTISSANGAANFTATAIPTYTISGTVTNGSGATVALTGATSASTTADASGNYSFAGLANGSYTVTPSKSGFTMSPPSTAVTVNSANATANFTATAIPTYTISGTVTNGGGATVALTGATSASTTADASGNYSFAGLANGSYTVTPSKSGFTMSPPSAAVTISSANGTANFTATAIPTYTISGTVTNGSGATVALTGNASASTTADASGNYSFAGLANGSYTVTPSKSGFTMSPPSTAVTISSANGTANFTATAIPTYTISGAITPAASGSGATVTLSGAASATTTADVNGNYSFTGRVNGSYTVTPSKTGFTFTPSNAAVTVNNSDVTVASFAASVVTGITIDATAFGDRTPAATSVTTAAFSTTSANELLLAMVGADVSNASGTNNSVTSVTGAGLTWVLVRRTNTQRGTAEIWRAFATAPLTNVTVTANLAMSNVSSITVMSFRGVNTSGTNGSGAIGNTGTGSGATGTPTASLVTLGSNSLVVGMGEDWNAAPSVTAAASQTIVHQKAVPNLATFWAQRQNATTPAVGTTVTINDTVPTNHQYNLTISEILAAP